MTIKYFNKKSGSVISLSRRDFLVASGVASVLVACDNDVTTTGDIQDTDDTDTTDYTDTDADADINDTDADINDIENDTNDDGGTPVERPVTTVTQTVVGVLAETQQLEDLRGSYGLTQNGPGEPYIERDDFNATSVSDGSSAQLSSLAYFAQITDIHIVDEESPARAIHSDIAAESAWRLQEPWSTQLLDAAIRTINEFVPARAHDFVVFTGDMTDNHLWNEFRWFLDVVEGNQVDPDSGDDDNPRPSPLLDPHDTFQAEGLHTSIPWYACIGNHDVWILGSMGDTTAAVYGMVDPTDDTATQGFGSFTGSSAVIPECGDSPSCIDGYCYSETPDRCYVPPSDESYDTDYVVPDPNRAYVSPTEIMEMITSSTVQGPAGHGFTQDNLNSETLYWYDENPVPGSPVALVALDTTTNQSGLNKAAGSIDSAQISWLEDRLAFLQSQNKVVIVISHHPADEVSGGDIESVLKSYPNVVLHVVGHGHRNKVYVHKPDSGQDVWHGYWEIQTPSTLDWPQQMRFLEVVDFGDGTGGIYSTMVNFDIPAGDIAEGGRFYGLVTVQEGRLDDTLKGSENDRNVLLRFAWSPELKAHLAGLPKRDVESLHFISSK